MTKPRNALALGGIALLLTAAPAAAQIDLDTVRAGRFDFGRMWTFEYSPARYFTDTYGFDANQAWFDRARMSALRVQGCSASFVSPDGLVVTNHHCIRGVVARLSPVRTCWTTGSTRRRWRKSGAFPVTSPISCSLPRT